MMTRMTSDPVRADQLNASHTLVGGAGGLSAVREVRAIPTILPIEPCAVLVSDGYGRMVTEHGVIYASPDELFSVVRRSPEQVFAD